jgi:mRNA-degrading endonuclease RelE of RelBE toxin-antitoxin system
MRSTRGDTRVLHVGTLTPVKDQRTLMAIGRKMDEVDPHKRGRPLRGDFMGYRRVKAAGRYRIIFRVEIPPAIVRVIAVGIRQAGSRQDVYQVARKRIRNSPYAEGLEEDKLSYEP